MSGRCIHGMECGSITAAAAELDNSSHTLADNSNNT